LLRAGYCHKRAVSNSSTVIFLRPWLVFSEQKYSREGHSCWMFLVLLSISSSIASFTLRAADISRLM
uniref:Secreted protein n=1 Tax=Haemonchus placei TaxID=6290 RepID=A0A0N4X560_HAEPC